MAPEEKKGRGHFLCEKAPLLVMVAGTFLITLFFPLLGTTARWLLMQVIPALDPDITDNLCVAASSFLFLWLFRRWFSPDYQGSFRIHVPMSDVLRWSVPVWIFLALSILLEGVLKGFYFRLTFNVVAISLYAGFFEESIFRVFMIAIGMRYLSGENRVWWTLILSSLLFGLFHAGNILAGANVDMTIQQVINSVLFGLFMGALALRTGSVLPTAVLHTIYDILAIATTPGIIDGVMHDAPDVASGFELGLELIPAVAGVMLVKKYQAEILALWDEKWSVTPRTEEDTVHGNAG